jgi:hypothetical protein
MQTTRSFHSSDLRGFTRLAFDATTGITDFIEAIHMGIARAPSALGVSARPATGVTGLVYNTIRAATALVGGGIDAMLAPIAPLLGERSSPPGREAVIAALNGLMGDHLAATENPLAISMQLRRDGKPLTLQPKAIAASIPQLSGKVVVLVHGLCMNDLQWSRFSISDI